MQTVLIEAIKSSDLTAVQSAIERGADLNAAGPFQRTPLHEAAKAAKGPVVEWMLAHGAQPNARDGNGRTPLHLTHFDAAQALLRHGADIRAVDRQGNTALHVAAERSRQLCQLLIEAGIPADSRNQSGLTPLHFAALEAMQPIAALLLDRGADINAKTQSVYSHKWSGFGWDVKGMEKSVPAGETAISLARRLHKNTRWSRGGMYNELAEYLLSKGATERKSWRFWE